MVATGGLHTPTIRHHNGVIYMFAPTSSTTLPNRSDGGYSRKLNNHAGDIWSNSWTDPVYYDFGGKVCTQVAKHT